MSLERRCASTSKIGTARVRHEPVCICVPLTGVSNSDLLRYSFLMVDRLPIEDSLQQLTDALASHRQAVLRAPTGAGKTTRVPLALLEAGLAQGRIVMLEPRRLATRCGGANHGDLAFRESRPDCRLSRSRRDTRFESDQDRGGYRRCPDTHDPGGPRPQGDWGIDL